MSRERPQEAVGLLRSYAAQQGPFHSFWELAEDVDSFLNGRPTVLFLGEREWLAYLERRFEEVRIKF